jgi:hypothetical protein
LCESVLKKSCPHRTTAVHFPFEDAKGLGYNQSSDHGIGGRNCRDNVAGFGCELGGLRKPEVKAVHAKSVQKAHPKSAASPLTFNVKPRLGVNVEDDRAQVCSRTHKVQRLIVILGVRPRGKRKQLLIIGF